MNDKTKKIILIGGGIAAAAAVAVTLSRGASGVGGCPPGQYPSDLGICIPIPPQPPINNNYNFIIDNPDICPSCIPVAGAWPEGSTHLVDFENPGSAIQTTFEGIWGWKDAWGGAIYRVVKGTFNFSGEVKYCYAVNNPWEGDGSQCYEVIG